MKGVFNLDLIMASTIYLIGIILFVQVISHTITTYEAEAEEAIRSGTAEDVSRVFFGSEGRPRDWEKNVGDVEQVGLCVNFTNICLISEKKLNALSSLDNETVKDLINLEGYEFRILIKNTTNELVYEYKSGDVGEFIGISQKKCLMDREGDLVQVLSTVQVW